MKWLLPLLLAVVLSPHPTAGLADDELRVGHWLEVRGEFDGGEGGEGFRAQRATVLDPDDSEVLIGSVDPGGLRDGSFLLMGQPVTVSERTEWQDVDPRKLGGLRVKVEGHWHGPGKFSGREISARLAGRSRLVGRVDAIEAVEGGLEIALMRFRVFLPETVTIDCEGDLATIELAPPRIITAPGILDHQPDDDDLFGDGIRITDTLRLSGQLEWRSTFEEDFNLDDDDDEDRHDDAAGARTRLTWSPSTRFWAQAELRYRYLWRDDEDESFERDSDFDLGETFVYVRDVLMPGIDLSVGRLDFDDEREWIYDENLDAVLLIARQRSWRLELAASTKLTEGRHEDRNSLNLSGYLTTTSRARELALWTMYRDFDLEQDEDALWLGARALGEFLPDNESWIELATRRGDRGDTELVGYAYDVGTTWTPDFGDERCSLTVGYAFATGDDDPDGGRDETFRQTGFQDNNAKFAGVTSFRYYGELLDPELANLGVLTVGLGFELAKRTSLDLVFHQYTQDRVRPEILDSDLDRDPDGTDGDLGYQLDAILGCRRWKSWDLEIVGAWFHPGDAFDDGDDAFLAKLQLRYRF